MDLVEANEKNQSSPPITVLIADDDAPTRILLRAAVSQWGYQVIEAADGEEAWDILQNQTIPQLMIVDWLMPKLDGIDLCRRIKNELKRYPYIILLTQLTGTTNIVKGLEAGANEFLSKPFNMAELQSRLSVGSRIIRYEECLIRKNVQLKLYCTQLEELATMIISMAAKTDEISRECIEINKNHGNDCLDAKLNDLRADFKNIEEIIDKWGNDHIQDDNR